LSQRSAKVVRRHARREGWFIGRRWWRRTIPASPPVREEIFGPVVTAHAADDAKWTETLHVIDSTSPYALTGSAQTGRRQWRPRPLRRRRQLYINDSARGPWRPAAVRGRAARARTTRRVRC
jgi:acyl-CoA reductase-like NAD-dependent aldehyde dehydrogenase